ncbi:hypothetical protein ES695_03060 [Candidatus Atribacteria bacterium 1244-E10-H5-B2]|nr:MAG: hypothetical protein ES695_03060 [Candidatus Atribacteria bacterium 1244-E10-H5-B2]
MNKNRDFPEDFGDICKKVIEGIEKDRIKKKAELKKALIKGDTTIHKFIIPALIIFALILFIRFIRQ